MRRDLAVSRPRLLLPTPTGTSTPCVVISTHRSLSALVACNLRAQAVSFASTRIAVTIRPIGHPLSERRRRA